MSIFPHPVTLRQAMETRAVRSILPTDLSSRMLSQLPVQVRQRAIISAGVQNTDFLTRVGEAVDRMVGGESNRATERTALRELGFDPHPVDTSELLKGGGGAKCATLEIRVPR